MRKARTKYLREGTGLNPSTMHGIHYSGRVTEDGVRRQLGVSPRAISHSQLKPHFPAPFPAICAKTAPAVRPDPPG